MKQIIRDEKTGLVIKVRTINNQPSRTDKSQKDQCDIKNIMKKYGGIHQVPPLSKGTYMDLTTLPSYQEALHTIRDADQAFDGLPAKLRKKFNNDPKEMIDFLADPSNTDEAIKLGLVNTPKPTSPTPEEIKNAKPNAKKTSEQPKTPIPLTDHE